MFAFVALANSFQFDESAKKSYKCYSISTF